MRRRRRMWLALLAALSIPCLMGAAEPQQQTSTPQKQPSLGELARKFRAEKKEAPKAKQVWTNDNIPTTPSAINVVGPPSPSAPSPPSATPSAPKPSASSGSAAGQENKNEQAELEQELADAKQNLASLKTDLDILQREHKLDAQQFYGTPGFDQDTIGQARINAEKDRVAAKQQEVQAAEVRIADLEAKLKASQTQPAPPK